MLHKDTNFKFMFPFRHRTIGKKAVHSFLIDFEILGRIPVPGIKPPELPLCSRKSAISTELVLPCKQNGMFGGKCGGIKKAVWLDDVFFG